METAGRAKREREGGGGGISGLAKRPHSYEGVNVNVYCRGHAAAAAVFSPMAP